MTKLILIRHGQSEANIKELFAGHSDAPLSELGQQQAKVTAEYIHNTYHVDHVYSSDLQRAYYTGKATADLFGLEVVQTAELREIFGGDWEMMSYSALEESYSEAYGIWKKDVGNSRCIGGESVAELGARIYNSVLEIAKKHEGRTVVIATHATPVRVLECLCCGLSLDEMKNVPWVSNASVTELRYNDGEWTYIKRGYDEHLRDFKSSLPANV